MTGSENVLATQVASADFSEAAIAIPLLHQAVLNGSMAQADGLIALRTARFAAMAHRAHLVRALIMLNANRLFTREGVPVGSSWSIDG